MILDYNPTGRVFILRVQRGEADLHDLMEHQGLDLSTVRSTPEEAVLFTAEPYAAVTYFSLGTPRAKEQLATLAAQLAASWEPAGTGNYAVPDGKELWPFQKASIAYALERQHTLIGDEPGLGKTPIAIAFANEIKAKRVLVICPANIRVQWQERIYQWTTMAWPHHVHPILDGRHGTHPTAAWQVVSYELARSHAIGGELSKQHFDLLILDEAHYVKTIDSQRTRAIFGGGDHRIFAPIFSSAERTLALTGTPLPNRPREAYVLARGLCWDAIDWMSEDRFQSRFNPVMRREGVRADGSTYVYTDERSGRHGELQNRLRANLMVRHLKREVMPQLRLPVYDLVRVSDTAAVKAALQAESLLAIDPETLDGADMQVLGHIAAVRQQMGVAMAPQVAEYVAMCIDGGEEKPVVFAWHIEVLNILEKMLGRFHPLRIDGSTPPLKKQHLIDQFRTNPKHQVLIGNMLSMGTGTDGLQDVSTHALLAEPDWVPGVNQQAVDRLDRGGQKGQVQADFFVAPGSISERVLASALRKHHVTHQVLDERAT